MILFDVNILLYAMRRDRPEFPQANGLLLSALTGTTPIGWYPALGSSILRIATHPTAQPNPSTARECLEFIDDVRSAPATVEVAEPSGFWNSFSDLVIRYEVVGNGIPDAYLAATAIALDAELVSADRGFARFRELRFRHEQFFHA